MMVGWFCIYCQASGEVPRAPAESCLTIWPRILEAHLEATVDCDEKHGHAGIAVRASDSNANGTPSLIPCER